MKQETPQQAPAEPKKGRPTLAEAAKKGVTIEIEDDFVTIKIPKKELSRKLLAELI